EALATTEERIRVGGISEAVGLILLAERRKLEPLSVLKRELDQTETELARTRMDVIDLRERERALADVGAASNETLARFGDIPAETREELRAGLTRLLGTRAEILPRVIAQQTRLASALADAEQELRDLVDTTAKLGAMLDARLLWTPSHTPVTLGWIGALPGDTLQFFTSRRWLRSFDAATTAALHAPLASTPPHRCRTPCGGSRDSGSTQRATAAISPTPSRRPSPRSCCQRRRSPSCAH